MSPLGKKSATARLHPHESHVGVPGARVWSEVVDSRSGTLRVTKVGVSLLLAGMSLSPTAQEPQNPPAPSFEALQEFARTAPLRTAVRTGDAKRVEELLAKNPSW